jgi:endonuclease YncB( thermonuclease family)
MRLLKPILLALAPVAAIAATPAPAPAEWGGPCLPPGLAAASATPPTCHFWRGKANFVDDGDTIDVRMPTSTGRKKTVRVRITGIQAMEQSVYTRNPRKRRGECHAVQATVRLEQLIALGHGTVRLAAQDLSSDTGGRLRRSVAVKINGAWQDVGRILMEEGHVLWLPNPDENAWNLTYDRLSQKAALAQRNLWSPNACGTGPSEGAILRLTVRPNAKGNDFQNVNGERVKIENLDADTPVPLARWWLRDSSLRRFVFPAWAVVPPGGSITVRVGKGTETESTLFWGLDDPIFENAKDNGRGMGDGAYLFDPQGDLRASMIYPCYLECVSPPDSQ